VTNFSQRAREHYERRAVEGPHHPVEGYTSAGFRHYQRAAVLRSVLAGLPFASALDVGSADGFFVDQLGNTGAFAVGLDLSPTAATRVRTVYRAPGVVGDAVALPFRDDAFDLVMTTEVLEHVPDTAALVDELRRVARRWIVATVPAGGHDDPDWDLLGEGHVRSFDRSALVELFGPDARIESWRCNLTTAFYRGAGRHLGARVGAWCIAADLACARAWGSEDSRWWPTRTRSFLVVADAGGGA
jgi:SAM-dependent methyltransferase